MTKAERHAAIRERAANAIRDMYHNATPSYPHVSDKMVNHFQSWFDRQAEWEIEYIRDGGAYAKSNAAYRRVLERNSVTQQKSEAAQSLYVRIGMRSMRRERDKYARWEWINQYGTLYQYGRGGRTLAPENLVKTGGGSRFSMREDYCDDMAIADCVELIGIAESFNAYVTAWCKSIPTQWAEYVADNPIDDDDCDDE